MANTENKILWKSASKENNQPSKWFRCDYNQTSLPLANLPSLQLQQVTFRARSRLPYTMGATPPWHLTSV